MNLVLIIRQYGDQWSEQTWVYWDVKHQGSLLHVHDCTCILIYPLNWLVVLHYPLPLWSLAPKRTLLWPAEMSRIFKTFLFFVLLFGSFTKYVLSVCITRAPWPSGSGLEEQESQHSLPPLDTGLWFITAAHPSNITRMGLLLLIVKLGR